MVIVFWVNKLFEVFSKLFDILVSCFKFCSRYLFNWVYYECKMIDIIMFYMFIIVVGMFEVGSMMCEVY